MAFIRSIPFSVLKFISRSLTFSALIKEASATVPVFYSANMSLGIALLVELAKKCGFLAIDLYTPAVPSLMTAEELIADRLGRVGDVCREFSLRALLGCGKISDGDSQTRTAIAYGVKNTMVGLGLPTVAEITEPETTE